MVLASSSGGAGAVVLIVVIALYFIPTIVAGLRHVPNVGSVAVVNIFLGWTFIGWVVAMAMASRSAGHSTVVNVNPQQQLTAPGAPGFPPGWYEQPAGGQRYWDGQTWTEHIR